VEGYPGKPLHNRFYQVHPPVCHSNGALYGPLLDRALPAIPNSLWACCPLLLPAGREGVDHPDRDPDGVPLVAHHDRHLPDRCSFRSLVVWNFDLTLKIPLLGQLLEKGMTAARDYTEAQPWIRRLSTIGLIFFVFFPLQGTGTMNGSILGRLLGMDEARVFASVCVGSLASCLVISLGADVLLDVYQEDPILGVALLIAVALAAAAVVVGWRMRKERLRRRLL